MSLSDLKDEKRVEKILIFNTGGTMACEELENGKLIPVNNLSKWIEENDYFKKEILKLKKQVEIHFSSLKELLDSANASIDTWNIITEEIFKLKDDFDGIIIVHGTDTLSYTASAISFSLFSIKIPIILTASQYPLAYGINSDGPQNLLGSIYTINELIQRNFVGVYVFFNNKLLRANRIRKVHSNNVDAFHSVNSTPIGTYENFKVTLYETYFNYMSKLTLDTTRKWEELSSSFKFSPNVKLIRINPSLDVSDFEYLTSRKDLYIIILTAYGTGNGPKWLIKFTKDSNTNLTFFACSECYNGKTQNHYEVDLNNDNCKTLIDMTPEASLTKASLLLMNKKLENKTWNDKIVYKKKEMTTRQWLQKKMKECMRGEITNENSKFPNDLFFLGNIE